MLSSLSSAYGKNGSLDSKLLHRKQRPWGWCPDLTFPSQWCKPALIWPPFPKLQVTVAFSGPSALPKTTRAKVRVWFHLAEMTLEENNLQRNFVSPKLLSNNFSRLQINSISITQSKYISSFFLFSATIFFSVILIEGPQGSGTVLGIPW